MEAKKGIYFLKNCRKTFDQKLSTILLKLGKIFWKTKLGRQNFGCSQNFETKKNAKCSKETKNWEIWKKNYKKLGRKKF